MKDTTIRVDKDTLGKASELAERFGITQKTVLEQAVIEYHLRHIAAETLPLAARAKSAESEAMLAAEKRPGYTTKSK